MVLALFEAWPDAVKEKDEDGNTPLHLALIKRATVAMALFKAWPDAVKEKDKAGNTSLYLSRQSTMLRMLSCEHWSQRSKVQ